VEGLSDLAVMAMMSARVGSISDNGRGGWYSYRASKAGVNQLVRSLNIHLKMSSGGSAVCVGLHPGTVKTGLSKEFWGSTPKEKLFEPEFSAEKLVGVVKGLEGQQGGRCWDWKGEEIMP
jgi:NAD(P)-dependent dehydrogenase (short-subunit alcohol dehydrogenase family)